VELIITVDATVYAYNTSGMTEAQFIAAIQDAVTAFIIAQPVGGNVITPPTGYVYLDGIRTAIASVAREVFHVQLAGSDTALSPAQVATPGAINVALTLVPPPEAYHP
jgi:hypothetical protein